MKQRDALLDTIANAETKRGEAADRFVEMENGLADADAALRRAEASLAEAREGRVRAEASVEQAKSDCDAVSGRIAERLDSTPQTILSDAEIDPEEQLPPRDVVETKLERLIRERDNMGPVNLRAEQELTELEEQIGTMHTEREDLLAAIARLRQGISALNREGRERLLAAFDQVNRHFEELFVRLFGGGHAHLSLTEAEDPLEAGLEIMASPPGKKLQIMSLLSGGEQALTALSLLFAVFLTNPAPICVLDEVDAPLDDANVERFCTLLDEITKASKTQFLVVTTTALRWPKSTVCSASRWVNAVSVNWSPSTCAKRKRFATQHNLRQLKTPKRCGASRNLTCSESALWCARFLALKRLFEGCLRSGFSLARRARREAKGSPWTTRG